MIRASWLPPQQAGKLHVLCTDPVWAKPLCNRKAVARRYFETVNCTSREDQSVRAARCEKVAQLKLAQTGLS
jgi:hypothetical protein